MTVHSSFSGPLYQQVHDNLKSRIAAGEWTGGMSMPGDLELSRQLGVSIGTVRKALDELARQHLVVRERGRGTFIRDPSEWAGDTQQFLCDPAGRSMEAVIEVVEAAILPASLGEQRALRLGGARSSPPLVHRVMRTWAVDGEVALVERISVDVARFPTFLEQADLARPALWDYYTRHLRRPPGRTDWSFSVGGSDEGLAAHFGDRYDDVRLQCRRLSHDANDLVIEVCEQLLNTTVACYRLSR